VLLRLFQQRLPLILEITLPQRGEGFELLLLGPLPREKKKKTVSGGLSWGSCLALSWVMQGSFGIPDVRVEG
jgi:hypothetical protein